MTDLKKLKDILKIKNNILDFLKNKYIIITIFFLIIILPLAYYGLVNKNPIIGSYIIAISSIYAMMITNFKNNDNMKKQIIHDKRLLSLELRKGKMINSIEEACNELWYVGRDYKNQRIAFFNLANMRNEPYFIHLPDYIQKKILDFSNEIMDNNGKYELNKSFLFAVRIVSNLMAVENQNFFELYQNLNSDKDSAYIESYEIILNYCDNLDEDKKEKIERFSIELAEYLGNYNIDKILIKEFLS